MQYSLFQNYQQEIENYADNFVVCKECNQEAYTWINNWPLNNQCNFINIQFSNAIMIFGEENSGKTHLSNIWQSKNDADLITLVDISKKHPADLVNSNRKYVIEDLHNAVNKEKIMHIMNIAREKNSYLLFTSRLSPFDMKIKLPDLRSRLNSIPVLETKFLSDEPLYQLVKSKFYSLQLRISDSIIDFLINKTELQALNLDRMVRYIDLISLEQNSPINTSFIKRNVNRIIENSQKE